MGSQQAAHPQLHVRERGPSTHGTDGRRGRGAGRRASSTLGKGRQWPERRSKVETTSAKSARHVPTEEARVPLFKVKRSLLKQKDASQEVV